MARFVELLLGGAAAGVGFALGVGGTMAGAEKMRPLVKKAIKGYFTATERAREMVAEMGEGMEDLYAEAKAEHEAEAGTVPNAEQAHPGLGAPTA